MSVRYYLASGLDNTDAVLRLYERLKAEGHIASYKWWIHGAQPHRLREIAELEAAGVASADVVIVLLPGGRGTHVEMGMALAIGKSVVLVGPTKTLTDRPVAFYGMKNVTPCLFDDEEQRTEALCALLNMHAREQAA